MAPGVNAQKHVEEGLDSIPGQLNKRQTMEEARAWEVPHEQYPVMNIAAQVSYKSMGYFFYLNLNIRLSQT